MRVLSNFVLVVLMVALLVACKRIQAEDPQRIDELPNIYPDYVNVAIPVNIAPMEFAMAEDDYKAMDVLFTGGRIGQLHAYGKRDITINVKDWKKLLADNQGDSLSVLVRAYRNGRWVQFSPFCMEVKADSIDYGIVYRLIAPGYQTYSKMGIYQCSLADSKQSALYENTQVTNSCVNCHTFCKGNPKIQSVHFRGRDGATVLVKDGQMQTYESRTDSTLGVAVYPYWHPSGRYIVYSTNLVRQLFHTTQKDLMETFDMNSDVYVYDTQTNQIIYNDVVKNERFFETNPAFSSDGETLYFCRAARRDMPKEVKEVRYDLCKVAFDAERGILGQRIDTVLFVSDKGKSVSLPRPTSDGHYLVYAQTDYGCFPLYHKEADLWIMNLETHETRRLDRLNSDYADAFHNWSSNNHWLVFGSRRDDGMHTRPYFAYVDSDGMERKPFLLPQHHPKEYYNDLMMSYNCLEFVRGEVEFDARMAGNKLRAHRNIRMQVKDH